MESYALTDEMCIRDRFETMYEANGVGLAAPQVGILRQLVVIDVDDGNQSVLILSLLHIWNIRSPWSLWPLGPCSESGASVFCAGKSGPFSTAPGFWERPVSYTHLGGGLRVHDHGGVLPGHQNAPDRRPVL